MVCVGLPTAGTTIAGADPMYMCMKRLTIKGSLVGSMSETDEALAFAARGKVAPIYQVFPFKVRWIFPSFESSSHALCGVRLRLLNGASVSARARGPRPVP